MRLSDQFIVKTQWNRWRMYGWRHPLQLFFVAAPLLFWAGARAPRWVAALHLNGWQTAGAGLFGFILLNGLTAPFIFRYALPRQTELRLFVTLPLSRTDTVHLLAFAYHKFQLPSFTWAFVFAAGLIQWQWLAGLLLIFLFILIDALFFRSALALATKRAGGLHLERLFPIYKTSFQQATVSSAHSPSASLFRNLFHKEWFHSWRNPHYRRLKAATALVYLVVQLLLFTQVAADRDMWMMLASAALFWLHYAGFFNPKYVAPEPEWLFRSQPVPFATIWLAKFTAEFIFVLSLLVLQWIFLMVTGADIVTQLNWMGALTLFALAVLSLTLHFQILFFDNPSQAGYAYHLTVLFISVLSINFHLVGPLVSLIFLIGLTVQTIRTYHS